MIGPQSIWLPGPKWKTNNGSNARQGAVLHSSEGKLDGAFSQLFGAAEVSWDATIDTDGTTYEHYDPEVQCWHAHAYGNTRLYGIEFPNLYTNGRPDHRPLTDQQVANAVILVGALFLRWALSAQRQGASKTLWEHHEVPGNATECPSGRIRWDDIINGLVTPAAPFLDGLGVEYDDGSREGTNWAPQSGKLVVSVGGHFNDGTPDGFVKELWHP